MPIAWGVRTALSSNNHDLGIIPASPTLDNFARILTNPTFLRSLLNSAIYAAGVLCLLLIVIIPAAYALSRMKFKGRALGKVLLVLPLLPFIALLVPLTATLNSYGMLNQMSSVVLLAAAFQVPFACWLLRNFFSAVPEVLDEAARIIAVSVFSIISTWLSYLVPYALISYPSMFSLSQTLLAFQGQYGTDYPMLSAAALVTLAPPLLLFAIFQKWFIPGLFGFSDK